MDGKGVALYGVIHKRMGALHYINGIYGNPVAVEVLLFLSGGKVYAGKSHPSTMSVLPFSTKRSPVKAVQSSPV
jgi:hypothetical protein